MLLTFFLSFLSFFFWKEKKDKTPLYDDISSAITAFLLFLSCYTPIFLFPISLRVKDKKNSSSFFAAVKAFQQKHSYCILSFLLLLHFFLLFLSCGAQLLKRNTRKERKKEKQQGKETKTVTARGNKKK